MKMFQLIQSENTVTDFMNLIGLELLVSITYTLIIHERRLSETFALCKYRVSQKFCNILVVSFEVLYY